jgi:hypothetical protein
MLAFEVEINGQTVVVAGAEDWSMLDLIVCAMRPDPQAYVPEGSLDVRIGGMSLQDDEGVAQHLRWMPRQLEIGSTLTVRIVDAASVDAPLKRYRSDAAVQENPMTDDEIRELRYQDYLELKAEFEK